MIIKECFVTYNGISCITLKTNTINNYIIKNYINGFFLLRLFEIILFDIISKKDELKLINFSSLYID